MVHWCGLSHQTLNFPFMLDGHLGTTIYSKHFPALSAYSLSSYTHCGCLVAPLPHKRNMTIKQFPALASRALLHPDFLFCNIQLGSCPLMSYNVAAPERQQLWETAVNSAWCLLIFDSCSPVNTDSRKSSVFNGNKKAEVG